jgi:hypothetical protein
MERHQYDEKGDHLGGYAVRKNLSRFGYTAGCVCVQPYEERAKPSATPSAPLL